ncbi:hypothetical protein HF086_004336 [Spodoptera exigua]|uniref:HTH CENPB-type domain-containing protein n=1 Tax=Spodoptera exigua TaxID=7107 RepID=A0A922MN68_SPOEX|nr:hypothetical protein HF086_004336 [Spodoptera exigua]
MDDFRNKMKTKKKTENKGNRREERKKCDLENLKKALHAVKSGMSKKQAAREYQVPRSTIQFRLNNPDKINPRPGLTTVLTDEEENVLVNWIIQSSKKGFPRRKEDIQYSVSDFLKKNNRPNPFKNDVPGEKWLKLFLKRHPEVAVRTPESVTAASSVIPVEFLTATKQISCCVCPKTGVVLALKGDRNVYEIDRGQAKSSITVMFTFCANGDLTPPMIILPYKRLPGDIATKVPEEWGIGLSDNGWMKAELFYDYINNVLHPYLLKKGQMFPIILFVDGHKTHLTLQVSELCTKLKIILIALYPNCTRILQPADVAAFFPLKCAWKQSVLRWRRDHPTQALTKADFVPILKTAIDVSLKPATIKNGFKACGLLPWNPDALDYTKCLGNSKGKETSQPCHCLNIDASDRNRMAKEDFIINIVGMENINKIIKKDIDLILTDTD